jgi:hypothetical protein
MCCWLTGTCGLCSEVPRLHSSEQVSGFEVQYHRSDESMAKERSFVLSWSCNSRKQEMILSHARGKSWICWEGFSLTASQRTEITVGYFGLKLIFSRVRSEWNVTSCVTCCSKAASILSYMLCNTECRVGVSFLVATCPCFLLSVRPGIIWITWYCSPFCMKTK